MLRVELSALIGRLDTVARQGLEQAAVLCAQQQAPEVTAGHLLQAMLDQPLCDVRRICEHVDLDTSHLRAQLAEELRPPRTLEVATPQLFSAAHRAATRRVVIGLDRVSTSDPA